MEQLEAAAQAVYRSWMSERARTYRRLEHLDDLRGTAVTVQAMVFGNLNATSGAGVAFSRDPSTGAPQPVIEILFGAQGEDVVSGRRTPDTEAAIDRRLPEVGAQLRSALALLERDFGDVQDSEFTIENGKLWLLQTRAAKRTPLAALRFATAFVHEGLITRSQALQRIDGVDLSQAARQTLTDVPPAAAHGIGASAGIAIGRAAFDPTRAAQMAAAGEPVILVRRDTSTEDVAGFAAAQGIVTSIGGRTAHAALVARQMGKPSVVGCADLQVDVTAGRATLSGATIKEGDWLAIDGEAGAVYRGRGRIVLDRLKEERAEIESWRRKIA